MATGRRKVTFRVVGGLIAGAGIAWCVTWGSLVADGSPQSPRHFWIVASFIAVVGIVLGAVLVVVGETDAAGEKRGWIDRARKRWRNGKHGSENKTSHPGLAV